MKTPDALFETLHRPVTADVPTSWKLTAYFRRTLLTLLVFTQTVVATSYMTAVLPYHGGNVVELGIIAWAH